MLYSTHGGGGGAFGRARTPTANKGSYGLLIAISLSHLGHSAVRKASRAGQDASRCGRSPIAPQSSHNGLSAIPHWKEALRCPPPAFD